jgi:hypothetical protein
MSGNTLKNMNTPGGNSRYGHPQGVKHINFAKKKPKYPYYAVLDLPKIPNIHKKNI